MCNTNRKSASNTKRIESRLRIKTEEIKIDNSGQDTYDLNAVI